jgi:copper(I)-binding protein
MRRTLARLVLVALLSPPVALAAAQGPVPTATKAWVAEPQAGETTAIVSLSLENPGMYELYVVSASSPAAGTVELRQAGPGGAPLPVKELMVAAYGRVDLTAQGVHLALSDLKRPLKAGDTIDVSLVTDGGQTITAKADVRAR